MSETKSRSVYETSDLTVTYNDDPATHKKVYDALLAWFKKTEHFSGESICQSDDGYIEGPPLLGDLADDMFQFKAVWKE